MNTGVKVVAALAALLGAYKLFRKRENAPGVALSRATIARLDPAVRPLAIKLLNDAYAKGIPLMVASGYRSSALQDQLYAQGRTAPGPKVTGVKGGYSWHNYGLAFDVAVLKDGKPTWPNDVALWKRIAAIGTKLGLRAGANWPKPDYPHFEYHPGLTIQDAIAKTRYA